MKIPHSVMHVHTTVSRLCQSTAAPANINSHGLPDTEQSFQEKKKDKETERKKKGMEKDISLVEHSTQTDTSLAFS